MKTVKVAKAYISTLVVVLFLFNEMYSQNETEVLVLGTTHLNQLADFEKESLAQVLYKLNQYKFDVIGIENMSTELLNDIVSRKDSTYSDLIKYYGSERLLLQDKFQEKLNITYIQAQHKIDSIIGLSTIMPKDRINLINYFLAAGDLASAALQYNYLEKGAQIIEEDFFEKETINVLKKRTKSLNEIYSIAVVLAAMSNHQKLEYIDNLQDESLLYQYFPEFISEYMGKQTLFAHIPELRVFRAVDSLQKSGIKYNDLLPLYQFLNSEEYQKADYDAQWKLWLSTDFESKADLSRYALWEMRNLQISANILKLSAFYPGKRILIIIGSSHKFFIEKHLVQCPNIKLLKFE